jgi:hypothetical protein
VGRIERVQDTRIGFIMSSIPAATPQDTLNEPAQIEIRWKTRHIYHVQPRQCSITAQIPSSSLEMTLNDAMPHPLVHLWHGTPPVGGHGVHI